MNAKKATIAVSMALGTMWTFGSGCAHDYAQERPPTDQLVDGNTGLQAKDVVSATDHMASDLLALPELNSSDKQWTIVFSRVENHTTDPSFSYDVFSQRLRTNLGRLGHGRVSLIENRSTFKKLQNEELEPTANDQFGQGGGKVQPGPAGQNPDYDLYLTIDEMPNRASSYYLITATLTNFNTRVQAWTNNYEVQTAR